MLLDLSSFEVRREEDNIDILLISDSEQYIVAIENKVGSSEHSDQLNRYREILNRKYSTYKKMFIYLTPDGEESSDVAHWDVLSYKAILECVQYVLNNAHLKEDVKTFIGDYVEILRRDIVQDNELKEICNKIYFRHKTALDLILRIVKTGKAHQLEELNLH